MAKQLPSVLIAQAMLLFALMGAPALAEVKLPVPAIDQSAVAKRGFFYVGGRYVGEAGKRIMQGQAYVEVLAPKIQRRPYPLVLIHGAAQTATNWMGTPDGREGWAEYFVEQGYVVYMIDQPMRGRSAYHPGDGATRMFTAENEQFQFTAIETNGTWPGREKGRNCVCVCAKTSSPNKDRIISAAYRAPVMRRSSHLGALLRCLVTIFDLSDTGRPKNCPREEEFRCGAAFFA
jgi:hypothetical protein